jgi:ABC-type nitrate/sulfonate/bicarbonate transport system permease component
MSERLNLKRALIRHPGLARLGVIAALLLLWEIAARWWIDPAFLSPPSRVAASLGELFATKGLPAALRITFGELAVAFVISVAVGLVVGLGVGLSRFANRRSPSCRCSSCISASARRRKSPSASPTACFRSSSRLLPACRISSRS